MSKFKMPDSLDGLSVDELLDLRTEAKKAAAELVKDEAPTDEQVAEAEAIVEFIEKADEAISTIRAEETAKADRLARIKAAAEAEDEEPADETEAPAEDVTEDPAASADEVEAEPVDETVEEPEAVAAAGASKLTAAQRAAAYQKEPEAPMNKAGMVITAAADIAGVATGSELKSVEQVTDAAIRRFKSFPKGGKQSGLRLRQGIAQFDLGASRTDGLTDSNPDYKTPMDVLTAAGREARLPGGALTAAGGWCAPPEVITDFCSEVTTEGILDLPTMQVRSGSIRYTTGPDFSAIFADANGDWNYTVAQVEADTAKPVIEVDCPAWTDLELDVTGVQIAAGLLTQAAYPELVRAYVENVIIAHQHKVATRMYTGIAAASTALSGITGVSEVDSLNVIEMYASYIRSAGRMSQKDSLEVLLPFWYKATVKRDIANRANMDPTAVTDAQVNAAFSARNLAPQWLYNTGQDITEAGGVLTVPATVEAIFYRAGTFIRLTNDIITLDGIYDSTQLSVNKYTSLFTEEGIALANLCGKGYKVDLAVCGMGQAGALDLTCTVPAP